MALLNVAGYRERARRRLPRGVYEYVERGTEDEVGLKAVTQACRRTGRVSIRRARKASIAV